jgi:protein-disulfide isomerase
MARPRISALLGSLALLALSALPLGCKTGKTAVETRPVGSAAAVSAPANSAGPCGDYAEKLCNETGKESQTCASVKTTTELMPPAACAAGLENLKFTTDKLATVRKSCDQLIQRLCADLGPATQTCAMVQSKTKEFPSERCTLMLEHYTEVLADLRKMEASNKPLSPDLQAALSAGTPATFGPENARVTLVEFSDFQCPYCSKAADVVHKVKEKYGTRVRFVFRQFPLSFHPFARQAAEAALAAGAQGKFWEFHDQLFKNQQSLERADLEAVAKGLNLNFQKFKQALDDKTFSEAVASDIKLGEQASVDGTPTIFVNGARVDNPLSFETISGLIEQALQRAG